MAFAPRSRRFPRGTPGLSEARQAWRAGFSAIRTTPTHGWQFLCCAVHTCRGPWIVFPSGPSISSPSGLHRVRQLASQSAVHRHPKRLAAHLGITSALLTRPTPPAALIWARVAMDLP